MAVAPLSARLSLLASTFLVVVASTTCAREAPRLERPPATNVDAGRPGAPEAAGAPPDAAARLAVASSELPPLPPPPPRHAPFETTCDGKDDDGDGHVDLLLPTGPNACTTDKLGACGRGWAACVSGERVCEAPPPMPEVVDGIDNDCNGVVDDVPPARVEPRALVLGPTYVQKDAQAELATVKTLLEQAGVPFDVNPENSDWTSLPASFGRYSLLVIPGYLESDALRDEMLDALERFADGGGVVVVMKPMGKVRRNALALAGLKSSRRAPLATSLRIPRSIAPALASVDSPEERRIPLTDDAKRSPVDVWTFEVDRDTQVIAEAFAGETRIGAVGTRRAKGRGSIYAWGHDGATFDTSRCYLNCFEPSGDLLRLFLKDALREGARGHVMLKHPFDGPMPSVVLLTHDVIGRDAYRPGPWGDAGALQMAAMEKRNEVRATYFLVTDPGAGFVPDVVSTLCKEGFCPVGSGSATHPEGFRQVPRGTCRETRATYGSGSPRTVCGEVRTSLQTLDELTRMRTRAWRSPYLSNPPSLFDVLAESGVTLDSSFGLGDLKYNLPVDASSTSRLQRFFHHQPLFEFPIAGEDVRQAPGDERAMSWFEAVWEYMMLRNAANGSLTTLLVHPSRPQGGADDALGAKVEAVEHLIGLARSHGIAFDSLDHFGAFWSARSKVELEASYDATTGYTGRFRTGSAPVAGLTFEMGDELASFTVPGCGRAIVRGKLVVMLDTIPAQTTCTFSGRPRSPSSR